MQRLNLRILSFGLIGALCIGAFAASPAVADDNPKDILVHGKPLKKAMKNFSKGLGVKCTACHKKKDFESEEVELKDESRPFFKTTISSKDPKVRAEALAELLKLLDEKEAKDAEKVWAGIDAMELR